MKRVKFTDNYCFLCVRYYILDEEDYISISEELAKDYCYGNLPLVPVCKGCKTSYGGNVGAIKALEKLLLEFYIQGLKESTLKDSWSTHCFLCGRPFDYSTVILRSWNVLSRINWCKEQGIKRDGYQICIDCFRKNNRSELQVKKAIETKILTK